jgi:outer membrane lipoprotein-sorting protein
MTRPPRPRPRPAVSRAGGVLLAIVSLVVLRGASCMHVARPYPTPTPAAVIAAVQARAAQVQTIRAETRMSHRSTQGKIKATVRLMARRGGKLRCDAVSPFDTPLMTLVTDGAQFVLVDAQKNRHFYGPASPCNIARLLQVMLLPDDALTILGGSTPLIHHDQASLAWDDRAGAEVLSLKGKGLSQIVRLSGQGRSWDLQLSEIKDSRGEVVLRIEAADYRKLGALRLPQTIHVSQPKYKAELDVTFKQQEVNLSLPGVAFELPPAGGLPSQRVECDTELKL